MHFWLYTFLQVQTNCIAVLKENIMYSYNIIDSSISNIPVERTICSCPVKTIPAYVCKT